ncbi:hypothetical protein MTO96_033073 [Rhipicephalus appendiculatus]
MVSFNGYFGCTWCLNPGEYREGSLRYTVVSPIEMRTSDRVKKEMRLASQFKDTINGLKGPSALTNLKGLDLVNGYSVEYMHCVLLGVAKQITETILATSNSHQRFYSGSPSALSQIDARLLSIKPPHSITRLPRSIQERSYWKASEWRHWLLFYSLPCISGILIEEYWKHLSKLSEGVYILLQDELTAPEIDKAEFLLNKFVSRCEALYGKSTVLTVEEQEAVNCRCGVDTSTAVEYERPVIIADVRANPPYLKECFLSYDGTRNAFLPHEIVDSCLCIDFAQEDKMFICGLPNKIERD